MKCNRWIWMALLAALAVMAITLIGRHRADPVEVAPPPAPVAQGEASAAETPAVTPSPSLMPVKTGAFELPIEGATGFATVEMNLRAEPSPQGELLRKVQPGAAFRILLERGEYWRVESDSFAGYLAHKYCMINLPDVIPSIVYENTNASKSRVTSSGKPVPGVTGAQLYQSSAFDERLGREVFIMPTLYAMAKKVCAAQQSALREGDSLKIYEAYRPHSAQRRMVDALDRLAQRDPAVKAGISTPPWTVSWFVSQGTSNHQRGLAIDVSLVKVDALAIRRSGDRAYNAVAEYTEYAMPSPIHELSVASTVFAAPVLSTSTTAWEGAAPAEAMNEAGLRLQRHCADAGLTPLASEWWHFNDLEAAEELGENKGRGMTVLTELYSVAP